MWVSIDRLPIPEPSVEVEQRETNENPRVQFG
jgi:hypothetical protein